MKINRIIKTIKKIIFENRRGGSKEASKTRSDRKLKREKSFLVVMDKKRDILWIGKNIPSGESTLTELAKGVVVEGISANQN